MKLPRLVGLTGSIGMGKSTVAAMFAAEGVPVFDADAEVRAMQAPGGSLVAPIAEAFPAAVHEGAIDRDLLGRTVFGDPARLAALEAIVHPAVAVRRADFLASHADEPCVLLDIPLLFERGGANQVDRVVVVSAPAREQARRVLARPGMTRHKFEQILALQVPDEQKRALADHVIDTGTTLEETREQVRQLVRDLRQEESS